MITRTCIATCARACTWEGTGKGLLDTSSRGRSLSDRVGGSEQEFAATCSDNFVRSCTRALELARSDARSDAVETDIEWNRVGLKEYRTNLRRR